MANISREEDLKDLEERSKYGRRLHGCCFSSTDQAVIYNALRGTNFVDDDSLKRSLELEEESKHLLRFSNQLLLKKHRRKQFLHREK